MANQITYEQAMAQLVNMFPHVDKEVVAFMLESNKYHVERTVETLLNMTTTKPATPVANVPAASSQHHPQQQQGTRERPAKYIQTHSGAVNLTIQDDFLRPPNYFSRRSGGGGGGAGSPSHQPQDSSHLSQIDQDALLAAMLQDEMFMQDLAQHPERYMGAEQPVARPVSQSQSQRVPGGSVSAHSGPLQNVTATSAAIAVQGNKPDYSGVGSSQLSGDKSFADKWSSLTSAAKAKLANIASKFKSDQNKGINDGGDIMGRQPPNAPYQALQSNLDESLLGPSHDNAPRDDDFSLDDRDRYPTARIHLQDELPTSPHAAGSEIEMKERGSSSRPTRTSNSNN